MEKRSQCFGVMGRARRVAGIVLGFGLTQLAPDPAAAAVELQRR